MMDNNVTLRKYHSLNSHKRSKKTNVKVRFYLFVECWFHTWSLFWGFCCLSKNESRRSALICLHALWSAYTKKNQRREIRISVAKFKNKQSRHLACPGRMMDKCQKLKQIRLTWNSIAELPERFCNLRVLETLSLGSNKLQKLPQNLGKLVSLVRIKTSVQLEANLAECLRSVAEDCAVFVLFAGVLTICHGRRCFRMYSHISIIVITIHCETARHVASIMFRYAKCALHF